MADLPEDRLPATPPFQNVGMYVFGPFVIQNVRGTRSSKGTRKIWALILVCLPSRAIHQEKLIALDTTTFINALHRFTNRRGACRIIRSDNGANFLGTRNQIKNLSIFLVSQELGRKNISWELNPPYASHFGGVWERKIGSVRHILEGSFLKMGNSGITHDEFETMLTRQSP